LLQSNRRLRAQGYSRTTSEVNTNLQVEERQYDHARHNHKQRQGDEYETVLYQVKHGYLLYT
jgi:hypothetical protein